MQATASPNQSREDSPAATPITAPKNGKKRKRAAGVASPVPSEQCSTSTPPPERNAIAISQNPPAKYRDPVFIPISDNSEFFTIDQLPMNRMGFRYIPAGVVPSNGILTCHTIETTPACFRVSWEDRSPFVKVTKDGLGLLGDKGFRSARLNVPIREGNWFMEVKIERGGGEHTSDNNQPEGSHVRLGWGRREAPLNGPVGLDGYSYGVRDKTGEKVTLSRPRPYGKPFKSGDVIGMYISLPPRRLPDPSDRHDPAHLKRQRIAIDLRGQAYFETLEYPQSKEMTSLMDYSGKSTHSTSVPSSTKKSATVKNVPERGRPKAPQTTAAPLRPIPTLPGSRIAFFVNGECQGVAFQDLYDYLPLRSTEASRKVKEKKRTRDNGHEHKENPFDDGQLGYYPFVSLFNSAQVRINGGPDFAFPPPSNIDALLQADDSAMLMDEKHPPWRPICDRYSEFMQEEWLLDEVDIEEAKANALRRAEEDRLEAVKREQRALKRSQAEARKRKKLNHQASATPPLEDDRFGPGASLTSAAQPSPLRFGTAYHPEDAYKGPHSPAPTLGSTTELAEVQSGYNSEYGDGGDEAAEDTLPDHYIPSPHASSEGPPGIVENE
ncbi:hypothetical protein ONZ45_g17442 [Pleurotus djamor]|nr:hypothetical protein ONZ45_g17442 [Pleurotus djamor]